MQWTQNKQKAKIKQLLVIVTFLPIYDILEVIQYAQAIFNFIILVKYDLHDKETLHHKGYILYKLENTNIPFELYCLINSKLCQPTFHYYY